MAAPPATDSCTWLCRLCAELEQPEPVRDGMGSDGEVLFERPTKNEEEQRIRVYKEMVGARVQPVPRP